MVATLAHFAIDPSSSTPLVGASGAISGVLGAYLVLYTITVIDLLAAILLGLWFVWQLFQGVISTGLSSQVNVAFFAHIGGFVAGSLILVAIKLVAHEPLKPVNAGARIWFDAIGSGLLVPGGNRVVPVYPVLSIA